MYRVYNIVDMVKNRVLRGLCLLVVALCSVTSSLASERYNNAVKVTFLS